MFDSRVTERFETPQGHQAQLDWSPNTVCLGGVMVKVTVFCLVLASSSLHHYWASLDATQWPIFQAIEAAGCAWGSPKELFAENPRAPVDDTWPGHLRWNSRFFGLSGHHRREPTPACQGDRAPTAEPIRRRQRTTDSTALIRISPSAGGDAI